MSNRQFFLENCTTLTVTFQEPNGTNSLLRRTALNNLFVFQEPCQIIRSFRKLLHMASSFSGFVLNEYYF